MHTTDHRQPEQPDYPFLADARLDGLRDTYLGLRSFDQGGGVFVAVDTLATKLGISESTAHRHLSKLKALGVLQAKKQFQGGRQKTNFYLFPTPDWWVDPGPDEGCNVTTKGQVNEGCHDKRPGQDGCNSKTPGHEGCHDPVEGCHRVTTKGQVRRGVTETTNSLVVPVTSADVDGEEESRSVDDPDPDAGTSSASESEWVVPPRNRRAPWTLLPRRSYLYTHRDTRKLLEHFEEQIQHRHLREKGKCQTISNGRRVKWSRSANTLLDDHPVAECEAVVSWIFDHWEGLLPFPVVNIHTGRIDPTQRRVTRLAQIADHYPRLLAMMNQHLEVVPDPPAKRPKAFYDHGEGFAMEDQVSVLVELFAKTRHRPASDFDLFGWRKTFRIMLEHRRIPYEDIVTVVTALGNKRLHLDFARYHAPYDLVRDDREWVNILDWVKLALRREQMRPTPPPSPPRRPSFYDDDDFHPVIHHGGDTGGSVNMADSIAERAPLRRASPPLRRSAVRLMSGEEIRRIAWGYARQEFEEILARWCADDQPVDFDDLADLAVYTKEER